MKKNPAITDATRNNLIQAFGEFYEEKPIEKITVRDISQKAGYSRATFYNYFNDSYELLEYIEDVFISNLLEKVQNNIRTDDPMDQFVKIFKETVYEEGSYGMILFRSPYNSHFVNQFKGKFLSVVLDGFGISRDNMRAVYTLELYIPGMMSLLSRWIRHEEEMSADEVGALIRSILTDGVLAQLKL